MKLEDKILNHLVNTKDYVSGEFLAEKFQVSRAGVWKGIKSLNQKGYEISGMTNRGYILKNSNRILEKNTILKDLKYPVDILILQNTTSTNNIAKEESYKRREKPLLVIAREQSGGRGRYGRSFHSKKDVGLYMSLSLKREFNIEELMLVTIIVSIALAETIENICNISPKIKWVNDLYLEDKKIAGILTEAITECETGKVEEIIVGVGVNLYKQNFPNEIRDIAGYIGGDFSINKFTAELVNNIIKYINLKDKKTLLEQYREKSYTIGKRVEFSYNNTIYTGTVLNILDNGALLIKSDDREYEIKSGEVKIIP